MVDQLSRCLSSSGGRCTSPLTKRALASLLLALAQDVEEVSGAGLDVLADRGLDFADSAVGDGLDELAVHAAVASGVVVRDDVGAEREVDRGRDDRPDALEHRVPRRYPDGAVELEVGLVLPDLVTAGGRGVVGQPGATEGFLLGAGPVGR